MRTYLAYRRAGISRMASVRGQLHSWELFLKYAWPSLCYWWFWHITLPIMKRKNPAKFQETIDHMDEALKELSRFIEHPQG